MKLTLFFWGFFFFQYQRASKQCGRTPTEGQGRGDEAQRSADGVAHFPGIHRLHRRPALVDGGKEPRRPGRILPRSQQSRTQTAEARSFRTRVARQRRPLKIHQQGLLPLPSHAHYQLVQYNKKIISLIPLMVYLLIIINFINQLNYQFVYYFISIKFV